VSGFYGKLFGDDILPSNHASYNTRNPPRNLISSAIPSFQDLQLSASITLIEAERLHVTSKPWAELRLMERGRETGL